MGKYLVYAGCENEGTVLQGQPYDGPVDSASVAAFALEMLRDSIYSRSDTAFGLAELNWDDLESAHVDSAGCPIYCAFNPDSGCTDNSCDADACMCEAEEYFVSVELKK